MIIVIGGVKGGTGKSTISTNLTALLASEGKKVLLVDADEQRSASDWVDQRDALKISTSWTTIQLSGAAVRTQVEKLKPNYDIIIIDVGGRDTTSQRAALTIADMFVTPFQPRSLDIWTMGKVTTLISEAKAINPSLKAYTLLNRADSNEEDNRTAREILSEAVDLIPLNISIGQRKAFSNAAAEGRAVFELKTKDKKAIAELVQFKEAIFNGNTKTSKRH